MYHFGGSLWGVQASLAVGETQVGKCFPRVVAIDLLEPQARQWMHAGFRFGKYFVKVLGDTLAMPVERPLAPASRQSPWIRRSAPRSSSRRRQHREVRVVDVLQAVFEAAQELVGFDQFGFRLGRDQAAINE